MKKVSIVIVLGMVLALTAAIAFAEKAPQSVIDLANSTLVNLGTDPVIVAAVNAENSKGKTIAKIKDLDNKWRNTPGLDDFMKSLVSSSCGKRLVEIQNSASFYAELFVMDNQGANTCMSNKTSDYWQGDEAKFTKSYNGGAGAIHISDVKFDDSSQAYIVQVSVPVKDGGKVIGAITIGVDVDKI